MNCRDGGIVGGAGFEPAKAMPPVLQTGPFGRSGIHPKSRPHPVNTRNAWACDKKCEKTLLAGRRGGDDSQQSDVSSRRSGGQTQAGALRSQHAVQESEDLFGKAAAIEAQGMAAQDRRVEVSRV